VRRVGGSVAGRSGRVAAQSGSVAAQSGSVAKWQSGKVLRGCSSLCHLTTLPLCHFSSPAPRRPTLRTHPPNFQPPPVIPARGASTYASEATCARIRPPRDRSRASRDEERSPQRYRKAHVTTESPQRKPPFHGRVLSIEGKPAAPGHFQRQQQRHATKSPSLHPEIVVPGHLPPQYIPTTPHPRHRQQHAHREPAPFDHLANPRTLRHEQSVPRRRSRRKTLASRVRLRLAFAARSGRVAKWQSGTVLRGCSSLCHLTTLPLCHLSLSAPRSPPPRLATPPTRAAISPPRPASIPTHPATTFLHAATTPTQVATAPRRWERPPPRPAGSRAKWPRVAAKWPKTKWPNGQIKPRTRQSFGHLAI
jgi:hypothetical protein